MWIPPGLWGGLVGDFFPQISPLPSCQIMPCVLLCSLAFWGLYGALALPQPSRNFQLGRCSGGPVHSLPSLRARVLLFWGGVLVSVGFESCGGAGRWVPVVAGATP